MTNNDYVFYGQTTSLCEECLKPVEAKIIFENNEVFYLKYCLEHKYQKTLISTDIEYFKRSRNVAEKTRRPIKISHTIEKGCPYDCGLCESHEQHTAMGIVEILDECNLKCPTCIAASFPGAGNIKSISTIERMVDTLIKHEGVLDLLMVSGGEPTIHPQIFEVLDLVQKKEIKQIMLISNGVRIAKDLDFVEKLKKYKDNFEIYLQFDSLQSSVLKNIRGEDLSSVRRKAVENLERAEIHSTLISVVKKGLNNFEMSDVIDFALKYKYVRGVTFQPCKITGRNNGFQKELDYITLSEVRQQIIESSNFFTNENFIPHPLNPENICISYLQKDINIENCTNLLFSNSFKNVDDLKKQMYFLKELDTDDIRYENLFRVSIVSFLDKFNFCTSSVKKSCIHFVTDSDEIIPLDTYYMLYS
ncbi:radical SAM protein [uncultured Dokdonia sp.]|uniref:radical SAM protein n=1 Tax=uncultured Dokdonia sp. TaxID=575653 RepID=UPI0026252CD1|nr:radical SAM protein [uncultured Dokdonia sp.]